MRFKNHNKHIIQLSGPDKKLVVINAGQICDLPIWFRKYCPKYLTEIGPTPADAQTDNTTINAKPHTARQDAMHSVPQSAQKTKRAIVRDKNGQRSVIGMADNSSGSSFSSYIKNTRFSISNNVGVGILSYNRPDSLFRLLDSIEQHTDLSRTTVFVSDESEDDYIRESLKSKDWVVCLDNTKRLGIAGNTNRLLKCLSRFKYKLILNDDVEVLKDGWDYFYPHIMEKTGIHHFCYQQEGVYGSCNQYCEEVINGVNVRTIYGKPHGAVLALDDVAFKQVGYFDELFGLYGMEHVDWSNRISISGIQKSGFHDTDQSCQMFKIHHQGSSMGNEERLQCLRESKQKFESLKEDTNRIYIHHSDNVEVDSVSYVVPVRMTKDRNLSVKTVINNIKSQKYPHIEILLVEHDSAIRTNDISCVKHILVSDRSNQAFNKSIAFNTGVINASHHSIVLHDGDLIAPDYYTREISDVLNHYESFHIGNKVLYLDHVNSSEVTRHQAVTQNLTCMRTVGYFEGGSLGCSKDTYIKVGGFCEDFYGYGCEDCEFFGRLRDGTNIYDNRTVNFIHLHHGRDDSWTCDWERNKTIYNKMTSQPIQDRINYTHEHLQSKYGTQTTPAVVTPEIQERPRMLAWFNDAPGKFSKWFGDFVEIIHGDDDLFKNPMAVSPDIIYVEWAGRKKLDHWKHLKHKVPIIQWIGDCWGMYEPHMITHNPQFTTHTFVVDFKSIEVAKNHGFQNVSWYQHGNEFWYYPITTSKKWDVIFTGSSYANTQWPEHTFDNNNSRIQIVRELQKHFKTVVCGRGWDKLDIDAYPYVDRPEVNRMFAQSKIVLCHDIVDTPGFTSERTFDAWAGEHFVLMKYVPQIEQLGLIDRKNVVLYHSIDEAIRLVKHYIKNDKERLQIAANGYQSFIDLKLSYTNRIKNVLEVSGIQ